MKHIKKALLILITIVGVFQIVHSTPLGVENINIVGENAIEVTLSENPNLEVGIIDAEVTILNDVRLRGGFLSEESANEVELLLEDPIQPSTNYSLLAVLGTEGSIDFTTPEDIGGFIADNIGTTEDQDISKIEIIDDRTVIITFIEDLSSSTFEFKLLSESIVTSIEKPDYDDPMIIITVEPPFKGGQDYILMFIEMQDVDGDFLEFDTGIYDFSTPESEEDAAGEETGSGEVLIEETGSGEVMVEENDTLEVSEVETGTGSGIEEVVGEEDNSTEEALEDEVLDLNAAGSEEDSSTEAVAMDAETTPETGAATWILIIATLIINTFYYFSRRKTLKVTS